MPEVPPVPRHSFRDAVLQFLIGISALGLVTFAGLRLDVQPGSESLVYLVVVVCVSLRACFASSIAVSLVAVLCLNFFFRPVFSPQGTNPLALIAAVAFVITAWVISGMVARVRKLTETQLTLRFEERLAERTRVARELHDTLLQGFQGLTLHFQAVNEMLPPGPAKDGLEKALLRADQAIVEGRDAIQALRSSTTITNELAQSMTALGEELAGPHDDQNSSPSFNVSIEGTPRELHPILRDDIYRIAREALRNAFRHAEAKSIEVEITYDDRLLRLRIRDDGKGIDSKLLDAGRDGHWGLTGMRERAQEIGARLEMWSEVGAGTEVELRIPGQVAYGGSPAGSRFRLFRNKQETVDER